MNAKKLLSVMVVSLLIGCAPVIRHNARAGTEILDLYMKDYAITQMEAQGLTDEAVMARAVYAMYNARPDEFRRILKRYRNNSPHHIDRLFKEKYEMT